MSKIPKLFPYATTFRWNFLKRPVFSFRECANPKKAGTVLGRADYKPFIAVDYVYPEHLQGDGPRRFYDQVISEKPFRVQQFKDLLGWGELPRQGNAGKLDLIGDMLASAIEARPKPLGKSILGRFGWESSSMPIWESVEVDLAILLAECAIEDFAYLNPKWAAPVIRKSPQGYLDYPAIVFDVAATVPDDPLLIALSKEYQKAAKRDLNDGNWINIFDKIIDELELEHEDFKSAEYSPDSVNRWSDPNNNRPHFYPFIAAGHFLGIAFGRKFEFERMDDYFRHGLYSLGDCLRQETLPNWSSFPELPSRNSAL